MIIIESTSNVINADEIVRGTLIWAKHSSWNEGRSGVVSNVGEKSITVLFLPELQNVQNRFLIPVSELEGGAWQVRYSSDGLVTVLSYNCTDSADEENGG